MAPFRPDLSLLSSVKYKQGDRVTWYPLEAYTVSTMDTGSRPLSQAIPPAVPCILLPLKAMTPATVPALP